MADPSGGLLLTKVSDFPANERSGSDPKGSYNLSDGARNALGQGARDGFDRKEGTQEGLQGQMHVM